MDQDVSQIKYDFFINEIELLSSTSLLMVLQYRSVLDWHLYTLGFEPGALEFGLKAGIWCFFPVLTLLFQAVFIIPSCPSSPLPPQN